MKYFYDVASVFPFFNSSNSGRVDSQVGEGGQFILSQLANEEGSGDKEIEEVEGEEDDEIRLEYSSDDDIPPIEKDIEPIQESPQERYPDSSRWLHESHKEILAEICDGMEELSKRYKKSADQEGEKINLKQETQKKLADVSERFTCSLFDQRFFSNKSLVTILLESGKLEEIRDMNRNKAYEALYQYPKVIPVLLSFYEEMYANNGKLIERLLLNKLHQEDEQLSIVVLFKKALLLDQTEGRGEFRRNLVNIFMRMRKFTLFDPEFFFDKSLVTFFLEAGGLEEIQDMKKNKVYGMLSQYPGVISILLSFYEKMYANKGEVVERLLLHELQEEDEQFPIVVLFKKALILEQIKGSGEFRMNLVNTYIIMRELAQNFRKLGLERYPSKSKRKTSSTLAAHIMSYSNYYYRPSYEMDDDQEILEDAEIIDEQNQNQMQGSRWWCNIL